MLFAPVYNEIPEKSFTTTDNAVKISDLAVIDYAKYNDIAERFINTYNLDSTSAQLLLQMHVDVTGTSEEFLNNQNSNSYIASIAIPLTSQTVEVKITSAIPAEEQKILSYTTTDVSESFAFACRMLAIISAFFAIILWIYTYFSRNIAEYIEIKNRGIKERRDLRVLSGTTAPAVVVEMAFLSNPKEEKIMTQEPYEFAQAIAKGVKEWAK